MTPSKYPGALGRLLAAPCEAGRFSWRALLPALALALVGLVPLAWLSNIDPYPSLSPSPIALARPLTVTVTITITVTVALSNPNPNPNPNPNCSYRP